MPLEGIDPAWKRNDVSISTLNNMKNRVLTFECTTSSILQCSINTPIIPTTIPRWNDAIDGNMLESTLDENSSVWLSTSMRLGVSTCESSSLAFLTTSSWEKQATIRQMIWSFCCVSRWGISRDRSILPFEGPRSEMKGWGSHDSNGTITRRLSQRCAISALYWAVLTVI